MRCAVKLVPIEKQYMSEGEINFVILRLPYLLNHVA